MFEKYTVLVVGKDNFVCVYVFVQVHVYACLYKVITKQSKALF